MPSSSTIVHASQSAGSDSRIVISLVLPSYYSQYAVVYIAPSHEAFIDYVPFFASASSKGKRCSFALGVSSCSKERLPVNWHTAVDVDTSPPSRMDQASSGIRGNKLWPRCAWRNGDPLLAVGL